MRKVILDSEKINNKTIIESKSNVIKQVTKEKNQIKINRLLKRKRSNEYLNIFKKLDAREHVHNQQQVQEIISLLNNEFPELELKGYLLGIVSKCYLGFPYEVHTLDLESNIINHFKNGEILPNRLECARNLAMRGGYLCVEVYTDCCRVVSDNGNISVVKY